MFFFTNTCTVHAVHKTIIFFFTRVDTDSDGHMSLIEIESWIQDKIRQHFDEALEENAHIFTHMDPDGDGIMSKLLNKHAKMIT